MEKSHCDIYSESSVSLQHFQASTYKCNYNFLLNVIKFHNTFINKKE